MGFLFSCPVIDNRYKVIGKKCLTAHKFLTYICSNKKPNKMSENINPHGLTNIDEDITTIKNIVSNIHDIERKIKQLDDFSVNIATGTGDTSTLLGFVNNLDLELRPKVIDLGWRTVIEELVSEHGKQVAHFYGAMFDIVKPLMPPSQEPLTYGTVYAPKKKGKKPAPPTHEQKFEEEESVDEDESYPHSNGPYTTLRDAELRSRK